MSKKKKILRISLIVFAVLLCAVLTVFVLVPFIKLLMTENGRIVIQEKVEKFGIFAPVLFVLMELTHIVLAFIPGGPVEIIGGVLFGALWGLILCEIGIFFATVIIYNLVRKFGKPLVDAFVSEEKFKKFKFLHDEKKLELIAFIILMIPGTPKDVISYMTSLTDINKYRFYAIATIARIPSVTSSVFMGSMLGNGKPLITVIIFLITAAIGAAGIFISNYITNSRQKKHKQS
ncbi:MAG: VTT domain-containing protein [Clostridium sp.]|nr:VTT domain-containing protein [Clostridium sp.]MCM1547201.1 VTT domain-containing protein [Ruminococcus sp.]